MVLREWTDGRLNAFEARVTIEFDALRHKLEEITGDPVSERRQRRNAILVALVSVIAGGGVSFLIFLIAGALPHSGA